MKYFAAFQTVSDLSRMEEQRQAHVDFLLKMVEEGHIYARGKFLDGSGGLTIFQAESLEEARRLAECDPYVIHGVRHLQFHEWAMKVGS